MSKNNIFILSSLLSVLVSIILVLLLWDNITLKYINKSEVIGNYSENNHHQFNDTLRFIIFISFPLIVYLINCLIFKREIIENFFQAFEKKTANEILQNKDLIIFTILFTIFLIFFFLSKDLPFNQLDLFHEGHYLGGGFNFYKTGNLWTDNYVGTGLFFDLFLSPISWLIFDQVSIGSTRIFLNILSLITQFALVFFFFNLINLINLEKNLRLIFFIPYLIFALYLINSNYLNFRDIPIILSLSLIIILLIKRADFFYIKIFTLAALSPISLIVSLEKGFYLNFLYIFLLITFFLMKEYKWILYFLIFLILSWLSLYNIIGKEEFKLFISNSIDVARYFDAANGIIYPKPFSEMQNSSRATKNLIVILLNGIILISIFLNKNIKSDKNFKIFSILFFLTSLVFYKTGLSRSDGGHMKQGISLGYIQFLTFIIIMINFYAKKNKIINKLFKVSNKYILIIFLFLISSQNINFKNIKNFNQNFQNFISAEDNYFLNEVDDFFISNSNDIFKDVICIQVLNYESAINYLLKKKSCTKYNLFYVVSSKNTQENLIKDIKNKNVKYIIIGGRYDNWAIDPKKRYPYIYEYLNDNYFIFKKFEKRKILKKKNNF